MDDVERMYRHLVRTIRANFAPFMTQPFEVGELYQTILPYRLHRRELGLETNQDYEIALLELLSGARGFLVVDDRMRDVLAAAHASPNPDPAIIRDFASAHVALAPEPVARLDAEIRNSGAQSVAGLPTPREPSPSPFRTMGGVGAPPARSTTSSSRPTLSVPTPSAAAPTDGGGATRRAVRPITVGAGGLACPFCTSELPAGRQISFCPHCGQDLTVVHCPACGSELERGWKFCITCGRSSAEQ